MIANLWLRMVKKDIDNGELSCDYGRDEAGLVPHSTLNTLLCASLGHHTPGEYQHTGLQNFSLGTDEKVIFQPDQCGFLWETQFTNFLKFKFNSDTYLDAFSLLRQIRRGNLLSKETRDLLPLSELDVKLRDETKFKKKAKDKSIGHNNALPLLDPPTLRLISRRIAEQENSDLEQQKQAAITSRDKSDQEALDLFAAINQDE